MAHIDFFILFLVSFVSLAYAAPTPSQNPGDFLEGGSFEFSNLVHENYTISARAPAIPAWTFYTNADSNLHQTKFNSLASTGWRMLSLSAYGSPVKYAAIWVQRPGPAYSAIHGASASVYQNWFDTWSAKGYVSTIVTVTGPAENPTYAGVMEQIKVPSWFQRCGINKDDFEKLNRELKPKSMMLKSFREYGSAANRRYCGLWHGTDGYEKWTSSLTDSYNNYQLRFNAEVQKRYWRPAYVTDSEDHQISSMFIDTSIGPWIARHGLTVASLDAEYKTHMANYFYPIQIQGAGSGDNTRFTALFAQQDTPTPRQWTVNGPAVAGFKNNAGAATKVDGMMQTWMKQNGVRQAQVSIGKAGKILLERAYTWAEPDRHRTTTTDRFLLASVSKMFVAGCIQRLYDTKVLTPTTKVYSYLGYNSPADPRTKDITVEHLVLHQGGYNRTISPDPVLYMREIAKARGGSQPATMKDIVDWTAKRQLDFAPGTGGEYSNYGYMLLSYVVEKATGMSYYDYLRTNVLGGLDVVPYATAASAHISDPIFQETTWLGPDAAHPDSNLVVSGVYGGDGIYKESANGPSAMSCSASTLVKYIANHGKYS
jgi:CubicO group peptidase (beta-lactamase class C family)